MQPICSFRSVPRRRFWLLGASHAAGVAAAILAAVSLRLGRHDGIDYLSGHRLPFAASWGIFVLALGVAGLYDCDRLEGRGRALAATIAVLAGTILTASFSWATSSPQIAPGILSVFAVLTLLAIFALSLLERLTRRLGLMTRRCLVIGTNGEARKALDLIHRHPQSGLLVIGVVHCGAPHGIAGARFEGVPVLGTDASLKRLVRRHRIDRLIVAAPGEVAAPLLRRLRSIRYRGVALSDYVSLHEELTEEISVDHINDEWLFAASLNSSRPHIRRGKRALDLCASLVGLAATAPIAGIAALLIKIDSPGPALYRQQRLGRDRAVFTILKLRTMAVDAESRTGPMWAVAHDPRITRVGRWLRKYRIDEIPQLVNVLRGEMSVIGPRPERTLFVGQLAKQIPFYEERFMVQPGITGWAQVTQPYAASVEESRRKLQADLYYIKHMSFLTDVYIILRTVKSVLFGRERSRSVEQSARSIAPAGLAASAASR